jgi:hypothetical protein
MSATVSQNRPRDETSSRTSRGDAAIQSFARGDSEICRPFMSDLPLSSLGVLRQAQHASGFHPLRVSPVACQSATLMPASQHR